MTTTFEDIDHQASEWFAVMDGGSPTAEDEARFKAWLEADPRALGAYCRVQGSVSRVERVGEIAWEELRNLRTDNKFRLTRRRVVLAGGMAAGIGAVAAVGTKLLYQAATTHFSTRIGEVREVTLADGSLVTLNTNSEVTVNFSENMRKVVLVRGEALFDVAKNKKRPFIVQAGTTEVRAVGTSFAVSMLPSKPIQVLVKEGVVELKHDDVARALPVRVGANMRALSLSNDRIIAVAMPQAKVVRNLAWQYGQLAFDNVTLMDAAKEFARYSDIRIIVDPHLAQHTITGLFAANDPVGFARMSAAALGLKAEVTATEVKISDQANRNL